MDRQKIADRIGAVSTQTVLAERGEATGASRACPVEVDATNVRESVERLPCEIVAARNGIYRSHEDAITAMLVANEIVEAAEAALAHQVGVCRAVGRSWDEIGQAFGISRQAAWARWAQNVRG